ncbi:uncharacterized protein LY79DRAFT_129948 [Colletotrichum navitas]|uniref:Secreted protein n=1 Tax=Colletotrichum navitas TaxID=681940 RepID=A0AAD8PJK4_9PEZI|nr:uncharacterized protein LY79DRAFT_129948 [Colletotrichum navitas]KAK1565873.1 hypothetical protein LY79DRAFT_129948 [Colletotrichum navitas]
MNSYVALAALCILSAFAVFGCVRGRVSPMKRFLSCSQAPMPRWEPAGVLSLKCRMSIICKSPLAADGNFEVYAL